MPEQTKLETEIGKLADLLRTELAALWQKTFRCPPPKGINRGLLARAIAWQWQAKHFGGLPPRVNRQLKKLAPVAGPRSGSEAGTERRAAAAIFVGHSSKLHPGTRLIREWHGKSHLVDVTDDGFLFEGRTYASLSAIAREITGAHWSGPRFFGL